MEKDKPASFADLQKRIGRNTLSAKVLAELPAVFIAFDLLEYAGHDIRQAIQMERRSSLENIVRGINALGLILSPLIEAPDWQTLGTMRGTSRSRTVEGMMLKVWMHNTEWAALTRPVSGGNGKLILIRLMRY